MQPSPLQLLIPQALYCTHTMFVLPTAAPNNNEQLWSSIWSEAAEGGLCTGLSQARAAGSAASFDTLSCAMRVFACYALNFALHAPVSQPSSRPVRLPAAGAVDAAGSAAPRPVQPGCATVQQQPEQRQHQRSRHCAGGGGRLRQAAAHCLQGWVSEAEWALASCACQRGQCCTLAEALACFRWPPVPANPFLATCRRLWLACCRAPKALSSVSLCFKPGSFALVDCPAAWKSDCPGGCEMGWHAAELPVQHALVQRLCKETLRAHQGCPER